MTPEQAQEMIGLLQAIKDNSDSLLSSMRFLAANLAFMAQAITGIVVLLLLLGIPLVILSRPRSD